MRTLLPLFVGLLAFVSQAFAAPAPTFTATDSAGRTHNLSDYKGKIVVLEWFNNQCPYVKKHYETHNMQNLQKKYRDQGVVWLMVNSSAPGKQGSLSNEKVQELWKNWEIAADAYLQDPSGTIGKMYGAKATPHMYVISAAGELVYQGAIDDNDSSSHSSVASAKNYVSQVLDELLTGKTVSVKSTEAYGCSIKYTA